jgi:hypothetical protein
MGISLDLVTRFCFYTPPAPRIESHLLGGQAFIAIQLRWHFL